MGLWKRPTDNRLASRGITGFRRKQSGLKSRSLRFQKIESRKMLAADLDIVGFDANGSDVVVHYDVGSENVAAFDIAIYSSIDGVNLDTLLGTQRVTDSSKLAVGTGYSQTVALNFTDTASDYRLIAVLDSANEIAESDESNNQLLFEGGVFQTSDGVVHVQGDNAADTVSITQGTSINVTLGSVTRTYSVASVAGINVRLHDGNDTLTTSSNVQVSVQGYGGDGDDTMYGGYGDDALDGGAGNDSLYGGGGNDTLEGGSGNDALSGDAGSDTYVFSRLGSQNLGTDTITESANTDSDTLDFTQFGDAVTVNLSTTGNQAVHTDLTLSINNNTAIENVQGSAYGDVITGNARANDLDGNGGDDTMYGGYGDDALDGGAGNDSLYGGEGNDTLEGGSGNDALAGEAGSDTYVFSRVGSQNLGTDTITESTNADSDTLDFRQFGNAVTVNLSTTGNQTVSADLTLSINNNTAIENAQGSAYGDVITGNARANDLDGNGGDDTMYGGYGDDALDGGAGADTIRGGEGDDTVSGGYGNDWIDGEAGNDTLYGNDGDDTLYGGLGDDFLNGGGGVDALYSGGQYGDVVADKPVISGFLVDGPSAGIWIFSGSIVDDGAVAGRTVVFGGLLQGYTAIVQADGTFSITVPLEEGVYDIVFVNFTDEEGLSADQVDALVIDPF